LDYLEGNGLGFLSFPFVRLSFLPFLTVLFTGRFHVFPLFKYVLLTRGVNKGKEQGFVIITQVFKAWKQEKGPQFLIGANYFSPLISSPEFKTNLGQVFPQGQRLGLGSHTQFGSRKGQF